MILKQSVKGNQTDDYYGKMVNCFSNVFFDVGPFAAILIADRTHGRSQEFILGGSPMHFGRTMSPENASSGLKCLLVTVSRFNSEEPLYATGRTLRFRGLHLCCPTVSVTSQFVIVVDFC